MIESLREKRRLKSVFDEIANAYDLVYFGQTSMHESDDPVLGVTFDANAKDDHFMHGSINDYEINLLHRSVELSHPALTAANFDWTIVRVRLKTDDLPHIFIDAHAYDEVLYKHIFAKFQKLKAVTGDLLKNVSFKEHFSVFSTPDTGSKINHYFDDTAMQHMLENMSNIDIEIDDNELILCRNGAPQQRRQVDELINQAMWLAEHIERRHQTIDESQEI